MNAEINTLFDNLKIPNSWREMYETWSESITSDKIKDKFDNFFQPLSEQSFYFDNPINLVQYLDSSGVVNLGDVKRIFRAYTQATDMKNTYILLHWIPHYQPWPADKQRVVSTLMDLLPSSSYVIIDVHDMEIFTNQFINFTTVSSNIIDPVGNIRSDYLLALWQWKHRISTQHNHRADGTHHEKSSKLAFLDFRFQDMVERGYNYYSMNVFPSATNTSREYWLVDARIDWVGLLPRVFQELDAIHSPNPLAPKAKERYHYLGIPVMSCIESNSSNDGDSKPTNHVGQRMITALYDRFSKYQNAWSHLKLDNADATISSPIYSAIPSLSSMYFHPFLARFSDPLLNHMVDTIRNSTHILHQDGSLGIILSEIHQLKYHDISSVGIAEGLVASDFDSHIICSSNHTTSVSCDEALYGEYLDFESTFRACDIDAQHSRGGKLYRSLTTCIHR